MRPAEDESEDRRVCEVITRQHARTFALASCFLPSHKRRAAFAIYAFCRQADDIVDDGEGTGWNRAARTTIGGGLEAGRAAERLAGYRERLDRALGGEPDDAVFREVVRVVHSFGVPPGVLHELIDGVERDLYPAGYRTWEELEHYCHGVASTVGVMCTHIFGVAPGCDRAQVLSHAETLGVAMQLTNILRDVGEDSARGRCYLPVADLDRFGISDHEIAALTLSATDPRWQALMRFQIARARQLYSRAHDGIAALESDSQRCATACAVGYAHILDAIERIGCDTLTRRARVQLPCKLRVLWHAWSRTGPAWLRAPGCLPATV